MDKGLPITVRIDLDDPVSGFQLAVLGDAGQGDIQVAIHIKGHAVRQGRKVLGIDFGRTEAAVFLDLDTNAVVARTLQDVDCIFVGVDSRPIGKINSGGDDLAPTVRTNAHHCAVGLGVHKLLEHLAARLGTGVRDVQIALGVIAGEVRNRNRKVSGMVGNERDFPVL